MATFFLIANTDSTQEHHDGEWWKIDWRREDIVMLKEMIRGGHEIGSHSLTHEPNEMPTQPDREARESKALIEGWLGTGVSSFA